MDDCIVYFNLDTQSLYYIGSIKDRGRDFCFSIDFNIS